MSEELAPADDAIAAVGVAWAVWPGSGAADIHSNRHPTRKLEIFKVNLITLDPYPFAPRIPGLLAPDKERLPAKTFRKERTWQVVWQVEISDGESLGLWSLAHFWTEHPTSGRVVGSQQIHLEVSIHYVRLSQDLLVVRASALHFAVAGAIQHDGRNSADGLE